MITSATSTAHRVLASAPLLLPAVGIIGGVMLDDRCAPPWWWAGALFPAGALLAWRSKGRSMVLAGISLAALATGMVLHAGRVRYLGPHNIAHQLTDSAQLVRLYGTVALPPQILAADDTSLFAPWHYHGERTVFLLDVTAVETAGGPSPATGRVRVTIGEALLDLRVDERLEVFGWLTKLRGPNNPGSFDWATFQRRQGIVARLRAEHRQCVRRVAGTEFPAPRWVSSLRARARGWLIDDLVQADEQEASLLVTMVLGHRSTLDRRLNEMFIDSGCMHFLAVSGTHVLMLMGAAWMVGRVLRVPRRGTAWAVMVLILLYALVTDPRPPILRATIVGVLYCLSVILGRGAASLNWLAAAAILLVGVSPAGVFDIGFQLSFAAVLGVAYVAPSLLAAGRALLAARRTSPADLFDVGPDLKSPDDLGLRGRIGPVLRGSSRKWITALCVTLAVSIGAWVVGLPLSLYHFQRVQPWGAINSVLIMPLITAITILGGLKIVVAIVSPSASLLLGALIHWADGWLLSFVEWMAAMPGASWFGRSPPWWWLLLVYAGFGLLVAMFPPAWRMRVEDPDVPVAARTGRKLVVLGSMLVTLIAATWMVYGTRSADGGLRVTVLSVGAGSCAVVELPDGRAMLFDAGSSSHPGAGGSAIVPYLRTRGIDELDAVYISHANLDHYNALPDVLTAIPARRVILTPYFARGAAAHSPARKLLDWLKEHNIQVSEESAPWSVNAGGVLLEALWPAETLDASWSANETSLVARLAFAGHALLITGDIESRAQQALLDRPTVASDVLLLPHHGAVSDVLDAFVRAVGARVLIRSSREPSEDTTTGLHEVAAGTTLLNTADVGAVVVEVSKNGISRIETPCAP